MKKLLIATVFLWTLSTNLAIAQKNYKPATIELVSGEKLSGFINYRNWERNPDKISFKKTDIASEEEFTLHQLNSFHITNEDAYTKAIVWKDIQSLALDKLSKYATPSIQDTVFLRILAEGDKIKLYELVDDKAHYFIKPQNDTLQELQFKRLLDENSQTNYQDYHIYRDQLKKYATGGETEKKLLNRIQHTTYKAESLTRLVNAMNGSSSPVITDKGKKLQLFAGAGLTHNTIDFTGDAKDLSVLNESPSIGYTFSVGMDIFAKRGLKKLFLRTEIRYGTAQYKGEGEVPSFWLDQKEKREYELAMKMITPTLLLSYKIWSKEHLSAYLGIGGGMNFTSYPKNRYSTTNLTSKEIEVKDNYKSMEGYWTEGLVQAGLIVNKRIEARLLYRAIGSFEDYIFINSKNKMAGIVVGWRF